LRPVPGPPDFNHRGLSYSPSQVAKIETGERIPKRPLALKLDEVFDADGHFARLQALVENTSVLPWFRDLYLVEGEATELRTYESYLIPGLLQTEAYARSAVEAERPTLAPADVDKAVAIRTTRQELFDRERPPPRVVHHRRVGAVSYSGQPGHDARPVRAPSRHGPAARDHDSGDRERSGYLLRIRPGVRHTLIRSPR